MKVTKFIRCLYRCMVFLLVSSPDEHIASGWPYTIDDLEKHCLLYHRDFPATSEAAANTDLKVTSLLRIQVKRIVI